ncbi:hypothetical protein HDV02_000660 [Globomyces sp. JEL0801]|nr:hypothetical protein HDV02_000660 [Globomyces sp. JEL0801]
MVYQFQRDANGNFWGILNISIDQLLDGIQPGDLIEFAGPSGCGKSQLSHFITLQVAHSRPNEPVLFIDSGGAFSAQRCAELYNHSDTFKNSRSSVCVTEVLNNIIIEECFEIYELFDLMYNILEDKTLSLSLIIIDSIGSILSPLLGPGYKILHTLKDLLRQLATKFHIPIILVNIAVSNSNITSNRDNYPTTKPALGQYWHAVPNKRLYFTKSIDTLHHHAALLSGTPVDEENILSCENSDGIVYKVVEFTVQRLDQPNELRTANLFIGSLDILSSFN